MATGVKPAGGTKLAQSRERGLDYPGGAYVIREALKGGGGTGRDSRSKSWRAYIADFVKMRRGAMSQGTQAASKLEEDAGCSPRIFSRKNASPPAPSL